MGHIKYDTIYYLCYTVYHIAVCMNGLQHMHSVLHRHRKDRLVRKTETVHAFVNITFTSFKKIIGVRI